MLAHRYRLLDLIGEGAQGAVHRARDEATDKDVAVKVLRAFRPARQRLVRAELAALRQEARDEGAADPSQ